MSTDVRSEIIKAIAATQDHNLKTVLLLLLTVLEELGGKIDAMRADEAGLKEAVLNGHSHRHDKHHDWVEERMGSDCNEGCAWAARKMREEAETTRMAAETDRADRRAARDTIIRTITTAVIAAVASAVGVATWLK